MKLTPLAKLVVVLAFAVVAFFSVKKFAPDLLGKLVPAAKDKESVVPKKADLPGIDTQSASTDPKPQPRVDLQGAEPGCTDKPEVRMLVWAWNAQMGIMYGNGGPQAAKGSLACQNGVNLSLIRQDDVGKMQENLVTFANELKGGKAHPTKGAHYVNIMGDGGAQFLKGVNDTLVKLGKDYTAKVVGTCGFSRGEDKFMGPPEWKANPAASRGGVVAGYLRDGDWNIAQKWLGDNSLCNNPDEKTYDPGCLNWVAANDYIDAAEKYILGFSEERPVVRNGKRTGEKKKITVNATVTWTPGDVNVATKKGGIVNIVSTKEYSSQMPCVIIGIDRWMKDNRPLVEGMLQAAFDGADQVKSNPQALRRAAEISAAVYKENDGAYWEKYFKGTVERDKTGLNVELGGSAVNNLADNLFVFGLKSGTSNLFAATYKVFGDIVVAQYPELVPSYPPVRDILDTSYVEALAKRSAPTTVADTPKFEASQRVTNVVSRRAWQITFDSGKATFTASAQDELQQLLRDVLVASSTAIEIHGHTDNVGTRDGNQALSESRAFAVKQWLEKQAPGNFPSGRVRVFAHGQENPVAPNATAEGKAQNRRVEIVLGTTGN